VIRSTSGTITIPEIGAKLEPGPYSEAFVSNVEGVLNRFVDILLQLLHTYPEKREEILDVLRKIGYIRHGRMEATFMIDDPFGNSAIVGENVRKRPLTRHELKALKTGEITLDLSELSGDREEAPREE
jgi:zinc finger protein